MKDASLARANTQSLLEAYLEIAATTSRFRFDDFLRTLPCCLDCREMTTISQKPKWKPEKRRSVYKYCPSAFSVHAFQPPSLPNILIPSNGRLESCFVSTQSSRVWYLFVPPCSL